MFNKTNNTTNNIPVSNVFTVIENELGRLHSFLQDQMDAGGGFSKTNEKNVQAIWTKIEKLHDILVDAAIKGLAPEIEGSIKDLQSTVGDLMLTGVSGESTKDK